MDLPKYVRVEVVDELVEHLKSLMKLLLPENEINWNVKLKKR